MRDELHESDTRSESPRSPGRRAFLRTGLAGAALAAGAAASVSRAAAEPTPVTEPLEIPEWTRTMGRPIPPEMYGMPSKYEVKVVRRRSDVFVNRQNWSDWSMSPLQYQHGIVTPNGVFFERHHAGTPSIDPERHRLVIHGMVKRPLVFTMSDLMRYPSVSRFHFLECSGNTLTDWTKAASTTVQQSHGLLSCAQWTGIPAAWLLDEAGLQPEAPLPVADEGTTPVDQNQPDGLPAQPGQVPQGGIFGTEGAAADFYHQRPDARGIHLRPALRSIHAV